MISMIRCYEVCPYVSDDEVHICRNCLKFINKIVYEWSDKLDNIALWYVTF